LDVNEEIGLVLTSDVYDTIGGYVLGEIGRRPTVGDTVTQDGTSFEVTAVDGLRVARIRVRPTASVSDPSESTEPIGG
jgi:CBS domain containing-hemolysin-like protein